MPQSRDRSKSVLIIEDHWMTREGYKSVLREIGDAIHVFEAHDVGAALDILAEERFDLIIYDWHLSGLDGLRGFIVVRGLSKGAPVLVASGDANDAIEAAAMQAGARAYLGKNDAPDKMREALGCLLCGDVSVPPIDLPSALSQRQTEVLECVALGMPDKEIALRLGISHDTVRAHVSKVLGRLGAQNRTDAVIRAARMGLLQASEALRTKPSP